jgi:hypothetical protein
MQINVGSGWHELVTLRAPASLSGKVAVWLVWNDKLPALYAVETVAKERDQALFRLDSGSESQSFQVELSHIPIVEPGRTGPADTVLMILTPAVVEERLEKAKRLS